jgi:hypothetical protein
MGDISNWATSSGVLTPYQLEMAQQGQSVSNARCIDEFNQADQSTCSFCRTAAPPITNYAAQQNVAPEQTLIPQQPADLYKGKCRGQILRLMITTESWAISPLHKHTIINVYSRAI